ncbi:MAG: glycine cleavage T C-terminal barrel domain-containing protein [Phycisphaerales bacterium]
MTPLSPIRDNHLEHEASFIRFGDGASGAEVVETFGPLELEYAAIRRGCALFDMPQRATIRVTGNDRLEFLNSMLTQELKGLAPGDSVRSFWLNRKGRIDADLRVVHTQDTTWFDCDTLCAERAVEALNGYLFAEDVTIENATDARHRLVMAGPTCADVLASLGAQIPEDDGRCTLTAVGGANVLIDRHRDTASPTYDLHMNIEDVAGVYASILGVDPALRVKRAGWHAFNIARIEAGTPLYHLDFGPDSLPAETGVLRLRVDFKKGCYLGQEVVARMDALGHPKQTLCALRLPSADHPNPEHQPTTGAPVFAPDNDEQPIGAVTSSTRSPMLGDDIVCFAQLKWSHAQPGSSVRVMTGVGLSETEVRDGLAFYAPGDVQPAG